MTQANYKDGNRLRQPRKQETGNGALLQLVTSPHFFLAPRESP